MTGTGQRAARTALDAARAAVEQGERAASPEDGAAALLEAWEAMEQAMQAVAGTSALTGQALLRELRQRDLLSLGEAHAIVDFSAAAERVRRPDYTLAPRDRDLARAALDQLDVVLARGDAPARPTPAARPAEPVPAAAPAPADVPSASTVPPSASGARGNLLGRVVVVAAALVVLGGAGGVAYTMLRGPSDLQKGRSAYASGDHAAARTIFTAAAAAHPELAEPHLYLGRMAREEGNLVVANEELRRAVTLEPRNYLTHRELASLLLLTRRPDLARGFYERAITLNPEDRTSLGYMGCTLLALNRPDVAQRFLARAGAGPWTACVPPAPAPGMLPAAPPR